MYVLGDDDTTRAFLDVVQWQDAFVADFTRSDFTRSDREKVAIGRPGWYPDGVVRPWVIIIQDNASVRALGSFLVPHRVWCAIGPSSSGRQGANRSEKPVEKWFEGGQGSGDDAHVKLDEPPKSEAVVHEWIGVREDDLLDLCFDDGCNGGKDSKRQDHDEGQLCADVELKLPHKRDRKKGNYEVGDDSSDCQG